MINKKELLVTLSNAPLYGGEIFHKGQNDDFMLSMGEDFCTYYDYAYGASKFVLIPLDDNDNYVIKIPYTGSYYSYYDFSYTKSYQKYDRKEEYVDYYKSGYKQRPWDYCGAEVQRYKKAEKVGLEDCFAKTEFLGYINNYPIYIQEKCTTFESCCNNHHHSKKENKETFEHCFYEYIAPDWLTDFRLYYGKKKLKKFTNFIHKKHWDDDLRDENIGYIKDRPVLIDYSGFLE